MVAIQAPLSDEQQMLQGMAREFARKEIAPKAEHYDRTGEFPWDIVKKAQEMGLLTINIPDVYGGGGASVFEECVMGEELSWACSGISTALMINNLASLPIIIGGTEAQKKYWLGERLVGNNELSAYAVTEPGAGSNVVGVQTRAVKKGDKYIVNGSKMFISNASHANFYTVLVMTDPSAGHKGLSFMVIEKDAPGITVGKHFDKLGQRASDTAGITFEDVEVPAENILGQEGYGFYIAMKVFDKSRAPVAAGAVGVAQRALDESIKYSRERETFGQPIFQHQAIGHKIADMAMNIEAGRALLHQAARAVDADLPVKTKLVSMAKAFCADMAMKATVEAVQVFGGYGYMKEYPVEKLMRDVKIYQIYEGTSEIQRNVIVRELFRE